MTEQIASHENDRQTKRMLPKNKAQTLVICTSRGTFGEEEAMTRDGPIT